MKRSVIIRRKLNSLARRLGWEWAPARPIRAWVSPTTVCNLRCRICARFIGDAVKPRHMSDEIYAVVRREILPYVGEVILTGVGEPLLAPLLPRMLEDCERSRAHVIMTTNGTVWKDEVFRRIARMGGRVTLSVDGPDAATMETVRPGLKFETFRDNVERLGALKAEHADTGFALFFNVVLLKMNIDRLDEIVEWAARLGVDCIFFSNFSATGLTNDFVDQTLERQPEIVNPALDRACALCERHGIGFARPQFLSGSGGETKVGAGGRLLQCPLPWWAIYIEANGSVMPCCQWWPPLANVLDAPFAKIWNGPAFRKVRREVNRLPLPPSCQRCSLGDRAF